MRQKKINQNLLNGLAAAMGFLVLATACTQTGNPSVKAIPPREAYGMVQNDFAVIVDVREESELAETGKVKGAKWFPTSELGTEKWNEFVGTLPKEKKIVFYCARGGRAQKVAEHLAGKGFDAMNMGGFSDWKNEGLPTEPVSQ